jgi:hypothetical protein
MNSVSAIISTSVTPTISRRAYGTVTSKSPPRWIERAGDQHRHGHVALADLHVVLQEDRHADRRDQRHEARAAAQRPVRDALDREAVQAGDEHRHDQRGAEHERQRIAG